MERAELLQGEPHDGGMDAQTACLLKADPREEITMSVLVRRRPDVLRRPAAAVPTDVESSRSCLQQKDLAHGCGELDADLEYVAQFGRRHGLTVLEWSARQRTIVLRGTAEQMLRFARNEGVGKTAVQPQPCHPM